MDGYKQSYRQHKHYDNPGEHYKRLCRHESLCMHYEHGIEHYGNKDTCEKGYTTVRLRVTLHYDEQ